MRTHGRARGFTLLEALMASAVLAVSVAALAQAVSAGQAETADALRQARGAALADALMEEVLSKPYADPQGTTAAGPDAGESSRTLFDNCDDYHGLSEAAGAVRDPAGTLYPTDQQTFTRAVAAVYGSTTISGLGTMNGLTVTVTVQDSARRASWVATRFLPEPPP